jgi:ribosome-binding factor A
MSIRQRRIAELVKAEVSSILQTRLRDRLIGFVTVTDVDMSPDLRHAKVFVSVLGDADSRDASMEALQRSQAYVRTEVAHVLKLRYAPEIVFVYDTSVERGARVFQLLAEIEDERKKSESDSHDKERG